jgi:hypothetical protein
MIMVPNAIRLRRPDASLAAPAKTQVVMLQLHNCTRARRRRILGVIVGVTELFLVATGIGGL